MGKSTRKAGSYRKAGRKGHPLGKRIVGYRYYRGKWFIKEVSIEEYRLLPEAKLRSDAFRFEPIYDVESVSSSRYTA